MPPTNLRRSYRSQVLVAPVIAPRRGATAGEGRIVPR